MVVPRRRPESPLRGPLRSLIALLALSLPAFAPVVHAAPGDAVDPASQTITVLLEQEPPQLDTTKATDQISTRILKHIMEGLLTLDARGNIVPGVAERWDIRRDGATFHLRADARWSDGQPVTAHDFVFSWRTVVDPATASEYAFLMHPVRNAERITNGELPVDRLGVHAFDDRTLEVTFEQPIAYFEKLAVFATYFPIREDFYRAQDGRYGADADTLLYNGRFMLTRWVHGAHLRMERNPRYWNAADVRLDVIDMPYVTSDTSTALNLFRDDKVVVAALDAQTLDVALESRWRIRKFNDGAIYFNEFNHREGRPTDNANLRRAILLATDPAEVVYRILATPANQPTWSLFPSWLRGQQDYFRREHPPTQWQVNIRESRRLLQVALGELGLDAPPPLVLLLGDSPSARKLAEYFQNLYRNVLGIDLRLDPQIFKQRLAKMTAGDFDIVMAGWGPDFEDPMTFADLFASWNLNNRGRYANPELDAQVRRAQSTLDPAVRMAAFGEIQRILHDDAVIVPLYERGITYVQHPQLKGYVRRVTTPDQDYRFAWIDDAD